MAFNPCHYPRVAVGGGTPHELQASALGNPYKADWNTGLTIKQLVIIDVTNSGKPIYQYKETGINLNYGRFPMPAAP
jgi:hypothetical protein